MPINKPSQFEFDPDEEDVPVYCLVSWDLPGYAIKKKRAGKQPSPKKTRT